jgi:hypothetical protein
VLEYINQLPARDSSIEESAIEGIFNVLNHPNFATPGVNGASNNSPTGTNFGCGCPTPDTAASNSVLGSGGSRIMQLGLKLIF